MKEVTILGIGEGKQDCPFDKETWAIAKGLMWKIHKDPKSQAKAPRRVDRIFNMDKADEMLSFKKDSGHYNGYDLDAFVKVMNETGAPFVTSYCIPGLEHCTPYPLKEITEKYGVMYFTNTICFMIALALYEGYDSIDLWGVNQAGKIEYINERRGVEFWLGLAAGMGTKISINGPSPLLHNPVVYGYKKPEVELGNEFGIAGFQGELKEGE